MAGTDLIELRGLRVLGSVGVFPEERARPQPLELDVDVAADLAAAGHSDALGDTVDYGAITMAIETAVASAHHDLLERLAQVVADVALGFDGVRGVTVAVRKLRPPVPSQLATVGVRITRRAGDVA